MFLKFVFQFKRGPSACSVNVFLQKYKSVHLHYKLLLVSLEKFVMINLVDSFTLIFLMRILNSSITCKSQNAETPSYIRKMNLFCKRSFLAEENYKSSRQITYFKKKNCL